MRYELNRSPLTVKSYEGDLAQLADFLTEGGRRELDLVSVTASDIRAWMVQLSTQGHCSARSVRRKLQAARALFRWMMREGLVSENPAAQVELARLPKRLPATVRPATLNAALDADDISLDDFAQVRGRLMVMMLYETGIRRAELIGLTDAGVSLEARELKVRGKRDKDRIIPFGPELQRWIELYVRLRDAQVGREPGCDAFFVTARGRAVGPSLVYRTVRQSLRQAGGTGKLSPHVLRHSFATAMLSDGAEIDSVKQLLGHESLAATQVYTHITLSDLQHNYELAHPRALKKGG